MRRFHVHDPGVGIVDSIVLLAKSTIIAYAIFSAYNSGCKSFKILAGFFVIREYLSLHKKNKIMLNIS